MPPTWSTMRSDAGAGMPGPEARVRAAVIVMRDPSAQHIPKMPLIEWDQEVKTLSADRAYQPFAKSVRLRRSSRRFEDRQTHRGERPIHASE